MKSMSFHTSALLADSINDASSTRKVYLLAAGLALLGIALVVMTVWFWRSTRHDPELLAPLEEMGARRFRRLDGGAQQQVLDRSRPADAKPMRWGVVRGEASGESEIDLRESLRTVPHGYDDLRDPALIAVALEESDDDLAIAAEPTIAPTFVPTAVPAAVPAAASVSAERDPLAEIDALLAQAGAVPGVAAPDAADAADASAEPAEAEPVGTDLADTAERAARRAATVAAALEPAEAPPAADDAPPDLAPSDLAPTDAAAIRTEVEEPVTPARTVPRGSKPGAAREVVPLVIVPVDHELRPSAPRAERRPEPEPEPEPEPVDDTAGTVLPEDDDEPVSIDPLLRMFNRNDG
jgi:hypothetical protein